MNDANDEFQIFGDFVASELRKIPDKATARRVQRKLQRNLLDYMDDMDDDEPIENNDATAFEYQVVKYAKQTIIKYKGISYRSGKVTNANGMNCPGGEYRCSRNKGMCPGSIEPVLENNGKVKIHVRGAHTCA